MIVNIIMFFTMYPVLLVLYFCFRGQYQYADGCLFAVNMKPEWINCGKVPQRDETVFYISADRST